MPGLAEGGHFVLKHYSEVNPDFNMPPPPIGDNVLTLERYDIHSGNLGFLEIPLLIPV